MASSGGKLQRKENISGWNVGSWVCMLWKTESDFEVEADANKGSQKGQKVGGIFQVELHLESQFDKPMNDGFFFLMEVRGNQTLMTRKSNRRQKK